MLTHYESEKLKNQMQREMDAERGALWKCAVGFVIIIAMSLFGVGPGEQHELAQAGSAHTASAGGR
jgi:hypothetical protein